MRFHTFVLTLGLALFSTLGLSAQSVRVLYVSGQTAIQRPDENAPRAVVKGETVIIGTRLSTGPDGRIALTPMPGVQSIITPNTTLILESVSENRTSPTEVTHQAVLDLKEGSVVSDLQRPDGVTYDYSIRTARGLAGARGTTYTVAVNAAGVQTVIVSSGSITLNFTDGTQATLAAGRLTLTDASGATREVGNIGELSPAEQATVAAVAEASIEAIANAIDAGLDLGIGTLTDAVAAYEMLGFTLSPKLQSLVDQIFARFAIIPAADAGVDTTTLSEVVTEQLDPNITEPPVPGFPSLEAFFGSLDSAQQQAFSDILMLGFDTSGQVLLTEKLSDGVFAGQVVETINLYIQLIDSDVNPDILVELGILGSNNITAVGADPEGLTMLINAYSFLGFSFYGPNTLLDEADFLAGGPEPTQLIGSSFTFPGAVGNNGATIYNVTFDAISAESDQLFVGATSQLKIDNTGVDADTFSVGFDDFGGVAIVAADLVDLNNTRFSAGVTNIIIAAATINLANINFSGGTFVDFYSKLGSANFGSSQFGKVNFITNVRYDGTLLTDDNFGDGVRGGANDVTGGDVTINKLSDFLGLEGPGQPQ